MPTRYPVDASGEHHMKAELAVALDEVESNFERYGLLDERVQFLAGRFEETLPSAPVDELSLLRVDGDMYGSTMVTLENLYPKLSGGPT